MNNKWTYVDVFVIFSLISLIVGVSINASANLANHPWPVRGHDAQRTGRSPYYGPEHVEIKWVYDAEGTIEGSPVIGSDGTIYITSHDSKLHAVDSKGIGKWTYPTGGPIHSSPAIGFDGTIYVGSYDGKLHAINPNGTQKWIYNIGAQTHSSPAVAPDGTVYLGARDGRLHAVNPDRTQKWVYQTGGEIYDSSPAIGFDGTVYIGSADGKLYAINTDGTLKWTFTTGASTIFSMSPSIALDGTIYIPAYDSNKLYAINQDGTLKWICQIENPLSAQPPSIAHDNTLYIGVTRHGKLHAVSSEGYLKWTYDVGSWSIDGVMVDAGGFIYFGSIPAGPEPIFTSQFYALTPDGRLKWALPIKSPGPPAMDSNGIIYVGSYYNNKLYAIGAPSADPWFFVKLAAAVVMVIVSAAIFIGKMKRHD